MVPCVSPKEGHMRKLVTLVALGIGLAVGFGASRATAAAPTEQEAQMCCKHCTNSQPCGDSCIPYGRTCHRPPGCAC